MKPFAVLNPSPVSKGAAVRMDLLMQELRGRHIPWQPVERDVPQSEERTIKRAIGQGFDTLIIAGGDGTLSRAVRCASELGVLKKIRFVIVPVGTCNDFFRQFGPRAFSRGARLGDLGRPAVEVDIGLLNGRIFVNNAGFGRRLESFRMRESPARVVMGFKPMPAVVSDGSRAVDEQPIYMALACNGPYFSGGLFFEKECRFHDGLLDIYWIPASIWRATLLMKMTLLRLAGEGSLGIARKIRVKRALFELGGPVWPQVDGEAPEEEPVTRVEISVSPERWRLIPPAV